MNIIVGDAEWWLSSVVYVTSVRCCGLHYLITAGEMWLMIICATHTDRERERERERDIYIYTFKYSIIQANT